MATIALTGATGFLGRHIARALRGRGARVVGVVRNPDKVPGLVDEGVELRRADLAEPDRLALGFAGADVVISNAALLPVRNWRRADHLRTNVRGTENVLGAAVTAGVRRIVHVSSVSAYVPPAPACATEDHSLLGADAGPLTPAYGLSKALAERRAWELAREHGLALTTVRPCLVYGAFDSNFMPIFVTLATLPIAVMPAGTWLPMVYAGDVAEAVALAIEKPAAVGRAYNLAGEAMSVWQFFTAWRVAGGRSARLALPLPFPFRRSYDTTRARTELGWRTRPAVEALRETLALDPRPWRAGVARQRGAPRSSVDETSRR